MSVMLTFFGAIMGTAAVLFGFYALVIGVLGLRSRAARPKFGVSGTGDVGQLAYWFNWDPSVYAIEAYRFTVDILSPHSVKKEARFTITMDPVAKAPFWQPVILPDFFKEMVSNEKVGSRDALVTVSLRTTDELCLHKSFYVGAFRKLLKSKPVKASSLTKLEPVAMDEPSVSSLDHSELVVRRDKLKTLIAQAKAKAASQKKAAEAKKESAKPAAPAADAPAPEAADTAQGKA